MQKSDSGGRRLVWDLPTRIFHWALAGSFAGAYLLAENDAARTLHVMFGYTVAGLVVFRLLWGFAGSRHARFSDFAYGPRSALGYLRDLVAGRARDYDGHNPAASWAIYGLLALAAATAMSGWLNYNEIGGEAFEEVHEVLANAWLALVAVHLAGVVVSSVAHGRNLVAAMITGYRAAGTAEPAGAVSPRRALGSALLVAVLGFWTWSVSTGGGSLLAGAERADRGHDQGDDAGRWHGRGGEHDEDDD